MKKTTIAIGAFSAAILIGFIGMTAYHYILSEKTAIDYKDEAYTWNARVATENGDLLIRGEKIDEIKHDLETLVFACNRSGSPPESFRTVENRETTDLPRLKLLDMQKGIATVEVINSQYLTQQMGSTGANAFLAAATFTLTENENVDAVKFVFKEGDHAIPGVYQREMFQSYWKIRMN